MVEGGGRFDDLPGTAPAFRLCISINAPIALIRALWFRYLSTLGDSLALVLAVGALWYWVGLNVESWWRDRAVLRFRWAPLRLSSDVLLIATGAFWGLTFVANARDLRPTPWSWVGFAVGCRNPWPSSSMVLCADLFSLGAILSVAFAR